MPRIAILIVAAGKGERAGTDLPKQYERLAGKPMLRRAVEAFAWLSCPGGDRRRDRKSLAARALAGLSASAPCQAAQPRQDSVGWGWKPWPETRRILC